MKDVFLSVQDVEDLPDEVTFALYNSETAATPIATQTFQKGEYAVDYDFSKLDGLTFGSVARFEVNFANTLNINGDSDTSVKIYEIWTEMEIDGTVAGNREPVSNGTLAEFLWASGAPISTYLALTYEGDEDAITIIPGSSLGNYISYLVDGYSSGTIPPSLTALIEPTALTDPNNWYPSGNNIYYTTGNVGIGTTSPGVQLEVSDSSHTALSVKTTNNGKNAVINIIGGSTSGVSALRFGDGADINVGQVLYNHNGDYMTIRTNDSEHVRIDSDGNVGIGTANPTCEFCVNGTIRAKEIIVDTGWSDFVFEDNYRLPPLSEVEKFISDNKHLPGIPTEAEVKENGVTLGNISSKLLQKIEELTLYVIDLKKENNSLKAQLSSIEKQLNIQP